ncbi:cobalt ABC transporter ATP-binding protein [Pediococcus damnosus LMG 28219]|uniref:heavy metal translocating P-type ATPase n=1 Tax=Pediococcus damnosus TaxID=51663 RepID=UPI00061E4B83|nr:heavy metal translocating P-type ATPase [Pediococcus damnosus]AMV61319.1 Lead, cadmium, zinc and mercury transporting ATPase [Pediococcus damnosus]AMV65678.1 Lead, cadmium, zinc and mercury transporting ATPase [Pediococcus damnosus]AMV70019.1 Lead, cadmium, zinc and mercury transporting ATPase [Pediococcus damnosus]KJU74088.1 cobalt ABC transporter ATP-binding protein [Pediococcus damnosus LMG 28219]PIO81705.1 heavy metal translocating P-type ATPase [Pediococcus damnosus]
MKHSTKFILVLGLGILALILEFIFHLQLAAQIIITAVGIVISISMLIEMIKTLRAGKYGVDLLAITAIIATLAVGEYWASIVVLVMLTGGDSLEDYAAHKAGKELQTLLDNSPQTANVLLNGHLTTKPVDDVLVNDEVVVKPGEVVPVDGIILSGTSIFDESSLTGESKPVNKDVGDELMSGSVNGDGSVSMKVTKIAADSQYQTIVKLVKDSEARPAHFVRLADRYAIPFTIISYVIAGGAWFVSKDPVRFAEVLVVASPCPLILAAPIALVSGMSSANRNGIIIKNGTAIEKLATAKTIAFDKTGTLTKGVLAIDQVKSVPPFSNSELLNITASAEQQSSHILARSIVKASDAKTLMPVSHIKEVTGMGVTAEVDNHKVKIGRQKFVTDQKIASPNQTAIFVAIDDKFAGYITFSDQIRPEAATTISQINKLGIQNTLMISGDQKATAEMVGNKIGISKVYAECLPENKITILKDQETHLRPVVMVGDGVNDAPSLTVADVGIAMGARGSTAASESADIVILKDDLGRVARALSISKYTMKIAKQSVLIGIFICIGLMLVASTGVIPALVGALFQEVVDTVTILWALLAHRSSSQLKQVINEQKNI